jgi:phage repressor protein C with HTH and peptisase S24 domain
MKIATTKERILQFIDYKCISRTLFFEKTGIKRGFLDSDKLNQAVSDDHIAKIIAIYPEVSIEWLLTGKGEMLKSKSPTYNNVSDEQDKAFIAHKTQDNSDNSIPLIPISAMAGMFSGEIQVFEYECERFVIPTFKGADFLIAVKGSSMYPKYNSGDLVACKKMPIDTFFQWNKVYVLDTEQGALIKRVKEGKKPKTLSIHSDNPSYPPFELDRNKIYNIALVVGVIRLE